MQVRRQNLEKMFLFQFFLLDLKPIHTSFIVLKIYLQFNNDVMCIFWTHISLL